MKEAHVIPMKDGRWRAVLMTPQRYARWKAAWTQWFNVKGKRLLVSPEMWMD